MRFFTIFFCCLVLAACNATTKLSGVVDPSYRDSFKAHKMVVVGLGMSIDEQKILENTLESSFAEYNVEILKGLDVFPPTRDYSNKNRFNIAKNKGADTILIVSASGRDISETYVPKQYHPGRSTSYVSGYGNYATVNTYTSPGYTTGGYSLSKPSMNIEVSLINTRNKDTIWMADGFSSGNAAASFGDLALSAAQSSVKEIVNAGLVTEKLASSSE